MRVAPPHNVFQCTPGYVVAASPRSSLAVANRCTPTMTKIPAAVDMSLSTQLVPYDEHDDVLWEQELRRSPPQRAQIAAEQARPVRESK